jgi:threonine/homoserine efflux transporter RhtA
MTLTPDALRLSHVRDGKTVAVVAPSGTVYHVRRLHPSLRYGVTLPGVNTEFYDTLPQVRAAINVAP